MISISLNKFKLSVIYFYYLVYILYINKYANKIYVFVKNINIYSLLCVIIDNII